MYTWQADLLQVTAQNAGSDSAILNLVSISHCPPDIVTSGSFVSIHCMYSVYYYAAEVHNERDVVSLGFTMIGSMQYNKNCTFKAKI